MLLVVDANVLVGELLRVRGRELFETVVLRLYISEQALDEALHEMSRRAARIVEQGATTSFLTSPSTATMSSGSVSPK